MLDPEALKAARVMLRRVDDHDYAVARDEGAQRDSLNMLDVVHHASNPLPTLNYLTPRRGAAWVSLKDVQVGMEHMAALGRAPRLLYLEGLMPPQFRQTLENYGLQWAGESQIFACTTLTSSLPAATLSSALATQPASLARWWYARGEFLAGGLQRQTDAAVIQRMLRRVEAGQAIYLGVEDGTRIVGVASLRIQAPLRSAEVNAFYLGSADANIARTLMSAAIAAAEQHDCDLIFVAEALDGRWLTEFAFQPLGSVVAFAAREKRGNT
jgi:N-acetylglutamate synthase-like GNAT family acetyltransferase